MLSYSLESCVLSLLSTNIKIKIYRFTVLFVALYGRETWSITLGKKHMLRVFENRALRKIIVSKTDEVRGRQKAA